MEFNPESWAMAYIILRNIQFQSRFFMGYEKASKASEFAIKFIRYFRDAGSDIPSIIVLSDGCVGLRWCHWPIKGVLWQLIFDENGKIEPSTKTYVYAPFMRHLRQAHIVQSSHANQTRA